MLPKLVSAISYVLSHKAELAMDVLAVIGALKVLFHYTPWAGPVDAVLDKVGGVVRSLAPSKSQDSQEPPK